MTYIVAYDIKDHRTRNRLARYLLASGTRLQKSVYAVQIKKHAFQRFRNKLEKMTGDSGQVAVFRICSGCRQNAVQLGGSPASYYIF